MINRLQTVLCLTELSEKQRQKVFDDLKGINFSEWREIITHCTYLSHNEKMDVMSNAVNPLIDSLIASSPTSGGNQRITE